MHIVAEFQVADDHARTANGAAATNPGTAGNANTPSHCGLVANADAVANLYLIVELDAVTDIVPELRIGEKDKLPCPRREHGTDLRHDNRAVTLKYSPETGNDVV